MEYNGRPTARHRHTYTWLCIPVDMNDECFHRGHQIGSLRLFSIFRWPIPSECGNRIERPTTLTAHMCTIYSIAIQSSYWTTIQLSQCQFNTETIGQRNFVFCTNELEKKKQNFVACEMYSRNRQMVAVERLRTPFRSITIQFRFGLKAICRAYRLFVADFNQFDEDRIEFRYDATGTRNRVYWNCHLMKSFPLAGNIWWAQIALPLPEPTVQIDAPPQCWVRTWLMIRAAVIYSL